jgi:arginase
MARADPDCDITGMAEVELVVVPYDSGHRDVRMGRGPGRLLDLGLVDVLVRDGHHVTVRPVESDTDPGAEIAVAFELARAIAQTVRDARGAGRFPMVLAGNCFAAVGAVSGLEPERAGVLWLDAHGDLNTPDTTRSGSLDGMALAALSGRCWRGMSAGVPGFVPLPDHRLALVGARDLDPPEEAMAAALGIRRVRSSDLVRLGAVGAISPLIQSMGRLVDEFYVHVDLDVLDPDVAPANQYAAPGGLQLHDVTTLLDLAARSRGIAGASLTAYDPAFDHDGRAGAAAVEIVRAIAARAGEGRVTPESD